MKNGSVLFRSWDFSVWLCTYSQPKESRRPPLRRTEPQHGGPERLLKMYRGVLSSIAESAFPSCERRCPTAEFLFDTRFESDRSPSSQMATSRYWCRRSTRGRTNNSLRHQSIPAGLRENFHNPIITVRLMEFENRLLVGEKWDIRASLNCAETRR